MTTNREYLDELAYRGDGSLTDWFEQEHVDIVRCRDCSYYIDSEYFHSPFCSLMNDRDTEPDGFCAWGERRKS